MPEKILLLGKTGQVGSELLNALPSEWELKACGRNEVDLEDLGSVQAVIRDYHPDIIINAAAYTAVDRAESEPEKASRINTEAVDLLAKEAKRLDAWLIHYSTDYVFDGTKEGSYTEKDQPNPLSIYGKTKLQGEEAIRQSECKHLIFRTTWVYGVQGNNFIKNILRFAKERDSLSVVADQHGAPTSATLISEITLKAISAILNGTMQPGTYNLAPSGDTTWHGLAQYVVSRAHQRGIPLHLKTENIHPISTEDYPSPAKRPMNSRLDRSLLAKSLEISFPDWRLEVECFVDDLVRETEVQ
jgi:dTDP-4-dehydrorhamnose reductase